MQPTKTIMNPMATQAIQIEKSKMIVARNSAGESIEAISSVKNTLVRSNTGRLSITTQKLDIIYKAPYPWRSNSMPSLLSPADRKMTSNVSAIEQRRASSASVIDNQDSSSLSLRTSPSQEIALANKTKGREQKINAQRLEQQKQSRSQLVKNRWVESQRRNQEFRRQMLNAHFNLMVHQEIINFYLRRMDNPFYPLFPVNSYSRLTNQSNPPPLSEYSPTISSYFTTLYTPETQSYLQETDETIARRKLIDHQIYEQISYKRNSVGDDVDVEKQQSVKSLLGKKQVSTEYEIYGSYNSSKLRDDAYDINTHALQANSVANETKYSSETEEAQFIRHQKTESHKENDKVELDIDTNEMLDEKVFTEGKIKHSETVQREMREDIELHFLMQYAEFLEETHIKWHFVFPELTYVIPNIFAANQQASSKHASADRLAVLPVYQHQEKRQNKNKKEQKRERQQEQENQQDQSMLQQEQQSGDFDFDFDEYEEDFAQNNIAESESQEISRLANQEIVLTKREKRSNSHQEPRLNVFNFSYQNNDNALSLFAASATYGQKCVDETKKSTHIQFSSFSRKNSATNSHIQFNTARKIDSGNLANSQIQFNEKFKQQSNQYNLLKFQSNKTALVNKKKNINDSFSRKDKYQIKQGRVNSADQTFKSSSWQVNTSSIEIETAKFSFKKQRLILEENVEFRFEKQTIEGSFYFQDAKKQRAIAYICQRKTLISDTGFLKLGLSKTMRWRYKFNSALYNKHFVTPILSKMKMSKQGKII